MEGTPAPGEPGKGITRRDLELVIRRAAELYTREAESDEQLSEDEVLRIADELGLPQHHVRRALYELPPREPGASPLARWYGPSLVQETRIVAAPPDRTMDRLEEYLVTRELLRLVRRQGGTAAFEPADDAISSVTRAIRRPGRAWYVARSRRVLVDVRPMTSAESHVRIDLDLADRRSSALKAAIAGGVLVGLPVSMLVGVPAGAAILDVAGGPAAIATALTTGITALGGTVAAAMAIGRARFANRITRARLEVAGLLDRLEGGGRLEPPPAPWVRDLRSRISGALRGPER
jgi:hypothetical protein